MERVIAEALGLPADAARIVAGHTSSRKTLQVAGLCADEVRRRLGA